MKMKRKLLSLLLALLLCFSATACSHNTAPKENYYFVLYNSRYLTQEDQNALTCLLALYPSHDVFALDVAECATAADVYTLLKEEKTQKSGNLDGIQILGTFDAVPSFIVDYKVTLPEGYSTDAPFASDYFYTNLAQDITKLTSFNIADFLTDGNAFPSPAQPVIRLPLGSGELSNYLANYRTYFDEYDTATPVITAMSSPIFRYDAGTSADDLAYFLTRAQNEWGILDELRIYTNQEGICPSPVTALGDIGSESLSTENEAGIREFFFSGHGDFLHLYRTVFGQNGIERQESYLSYDNISDVLDESPYFMNLHACSTAKGFSENLVREAFRGKCLGAFASSAPLANNGIDSLAPLDSIASSSNFFGFHYAYLAAISDGASRSRAFFSAQTAFSEALAACISQGIDYSANYEFGYQNLLMYTNFGIFEPTTDKFPKEGTNGVPNDAIPPEKEYAYLTGGNAVGNTVSLSASEQMNRGAHASINQISAVALDNDHVRFFIEVEAEGILRTTLQVIGSDAPYSAIIPLLRESCVVVIDLSKADLAREGMVAFFFQCGGEHSLWSIDDISSLY